MAKWVLKRVYVNSQGYTPSGTYYGIGKPIYWAADDFMSITQGATFRASNRDEAKRYVRDNFDKYATFYR